MQEQLNKRNTETFEQAIKELYEKSYDQRVYVDQLHSGLLALQERLNALEQQLIIQKVQLTGLGPSVRN